MVKKCIIGPMFSGKTTYLKNIAQGYNRVCILDQHNPRNTMRDLKNASVGHEYIGDACDCLLIDELHLFDAFHKQEIAMSAIRQAKCDVYIAGLLFDCYKDNNLFPIWGKIFPYINEIEFLPSRVSCCYCGTLDNVVYSIPKDNITSHIGDEYMVCCAKCGEKLCTSKY